MVGIDRRMTVMGVNDNSETDSEQNNSGELQIENYNC